MGCCGGSATEDENQKAKPFEGSLREKKRHMTDTLLLLALFGCWFIMTMVGFTACGLIESDSLKKGNLAVLFNPIDTEGRVCGYSDGVKDNEYGFFTRSGGIICVQDCPDETDFEQFYCTDTATAVRTPGSSTLWDGVVDGKCMYFVKSDKIMNRCVADFSTVDETELVTAIGGDLDAADTATVVSFTGIEAGGDGDFISLLMGDVFTNSGVIFGFGIGVAVVIAFIYVTLLRLPGLLDTLIWGVVFIIFGCLMIGAYMLWDLSVQWGKDDELGKTDSEIMMCEIGAYILGIFGILYLCMVLYLRKRIKLAIAVIKEAGHAMTDMPLILLLPVIQTAGMAVFLVPWVIFQMYLASSGDFSTSTETYGPNDTELTTTEFEYDANTNYAFLYMVFSFFWTSQFIIAMGQLIVAMTIASWYFTKDRSTIGNETFFWALKASWIHAGTAAFGSLVIAIIKFIRYLLTKLQKNLKKSQNSAAIFIMRCLQCCMWCVEKCMKFLNKNAYIQTAIYGYGFCNAARSAFFLLLRNIARVYVVSKVSDFVLLLGKLLIPVGTTFLAYVVLTYGQDPDQMNGIIGPLLLVYILAYFIAIMFNEIYGMCIQTILLCYVADEEMFENPADRFIPGTLRDTLTSTQKAAAAMKGVAPSPDDVGSAEEDQPASAPVKAKPAGDVEAAKTAELM